MRAGQLAQGQGVHPSAPVAGVQAEQDQPDALELGQRDGHGGEAVPGR